MPLGWQPASPKGLARFVVAFPLFRRTPLPNDSHPLHPFFPPIGEWAVREAFSGIIAAGLFQFQNCAHDVLLRDGSFFDDVPIGRHDSALTMRTALVRIGWRVGLHNVDRILNGAGLYLRPVRSDF